MTPAGAMDRRVQFRRASLTDDGLQHSETWADHGDEVWASYTPVRDSEKWAAGQQQATEMARFVMRWSAFTDGITAKDRMTFEGRDWSIIGVKQVGRREAVEITATAGAD